MSSYTHHSAQQLLLAYKPTTWLQAALKTVPGVSPQALQDCAEQISFTHQLVHSLRSNKRLGDKLYWVIFTTYMTDHRTESVNDILAHIAKIHTPIPRSTYFRLRNRAVSILNVNIDHIKKQPLEKNAPI